MQVSPAQVYQQVLSIGGTQEQAQVAAALVDGIESNGDPTELSDGKGPAAGLFQYEPGTWIGQGGGKYAPVAQDASWQDQVAVFVNGTAGNNFGAWGPDLSANEGDPNSSSNPNYGYSGAPQAGSAVANKIAALSSAGAFSGNAAVTTAAAGSSSTTASGGGTTASGSPSVTENTTIDGQTYGFTGDATTVGGDVTALAQINSNFAAYGFAGADLNTLTNFAWQEITNGTDPSQVALDIQTPGSQAYPVFAKYFPGFVAANQELNAKGLPAVSVSQYQAYATQALQIAQAAGLPPGLISKDNIGALIGGNVSTSELSARVNDAMTLAINSTPEQRTMFNQYFGTMDQYVTADNPFGTGANAYNAHGPLTTGQIAALVLDPKASEPLIHQQILAAQVGGAANTSGIAGVSEAEATQIAQLNPNLSASQIQSAVGTASVYSPLLTARPGEHGEAQEGTLSADQLIGTQLAPTAGNQRQLQTAIEVGKAPFSGGGGDVATQTGVVGAGSASANGPGK